MQCPRCKRETAGKWKCGICGKRLLRPDWTSRNPVDRFMSFVRKESNGCWMWTGQLSALGYGRFHYKGRPSFAHRVSWHLFRGEPKDNICHHCDIPACVNPEHLYDGTQSSNLRDAYSRGRRRHDGMFHPQRKLTAEQVLKAKELRASGMKFTELGAMFGLTPTGIAYACKGKNWSNL